MLASLPSFIRVPLALLALALNILLHVAFIFAFTLLKLLLPVHAPWSKLSEVIEYVRAVDADQAYAVHDGLLNDNGLGVVAGMLGERGPGTPTPYSRLAPGDSVDL